MENSPWKICRLQRKWKTQLFFQLKLVQTFCVWMVHVEMTQLKWEQCSQNINVIHSNFHLIWFFFWNEIVFFSDVPLILSYKLRCVCIRLVCKRSTIFDVMVEMRTSNFSWTFDTRSRFFKCGISQYFCWMNIICFHEFFFWSTIAKLNGHENHLAYNRFNDYLSWLLHATHYFYIGRTGVKVGACICMCASNGSEL